MINRVVLTGRLTRDLELRRTQSGTSVVSFTLAVDRNFRREGQPEADFINCVAWNRQAETMAQYLHRGSLIGVDGRLQTRNYENQQGQRVYVTEVVVDNFTFLESRAQSQQAAATYNPNPMPSQPQQPVDSSFDTSFDENDTLDIASDDLPF
ncbi:MAG: single-stranded DNA-binding protein [Absicoccus porci]|jgi:single-strand DNA-binding protein|uniref:Single-stranded DNA-binding protein n=2 Tax=Absicoccus porci TaxID=2486576 RepID=A0A3N0HZS0_9FIRM|nr:single-stranded DNA-binding protein [Absicoccus porci]MCI6087220.1 single-stranded DNA-binding protein [Absicoccus porci]MDD6459981.1 single-stranded DNA-binding protein [Absicoccus porci]MDD7329905.1 single-stranded DNA-binding protein [Absicoccus porci]MDY4737831.1 single-stranded DNA-binding protein [Absicoccus porci]RNM30188.1 single-stranded DNA-binding protein [Absicoccus porci]